MKNLEILRFTTVPNSFLGFINMNKVSSIEEALVKSEKTNSVLLFMFEDVTIENVLTFIKAKEEFHDLKYFAVGFRQASHSLPVMFDLLIDQVLFLDDEQDFTFAVFANSLRASNNSFGIKVNIIEKTLQVENLKQVFSEAEIRLFYFLGRGDESMFKGLDEIKDKFKLLTIEQSILFLERLDQKLKRIHLTVNMNDGKYGITKLILKGERKKNIRPREEVIIT